MNGMGRLRVAAVLTLAVGTAIAAEEREDKVPLDKIPKKVLEAVQKAVPGIKLTEAEIEKTRKGLVYDLEGSLDGKEYEIEVSADGKVLEIEQDDEDGEDDEKDETAEGDKEDEDGEEDEKGEDEDSDGD